MKSPREDWTGLGFIVESPSRIWIVEEHPSGLEFLTMAHSEAEARQALAGCKRFYKLRESMIGCAEVEPCDCDLGEMMDKYLPE